MSEFKFACPVCGQHIRCDSASSGSHMACPTCYRQLVVPQAPAHGGDKLILTAAEVQTRPMPGSLTAGPVAPVVVRRSPLTAILLVTFLVAVGAAAFVFGERLFHHQSDPIQVGTGRADAPTPVVSAPALAPGSADDGENWTLDLASARIPDSPAAGRLLGVSFSLDRATLAGGTLNLRQGGKGTPELGMTIYLFARRAEELAGKTITIEPTRAQAPKLTLRWDDSQPPAVTRNLHEGYALRLEFGSVSGRSLPGRIFLATPDPKQSFLAGTFTAEIRKPAPRKK